MNGDHAAVGTLGLLAEPFHIESAVKDFAARLGERLPISMVRNDGKVIDIGDHEVMEFAQDGGALFAGSFRPCFLSGIGRIDRAHSMRAIHIRQNRNPLPSGWIEDVECRSHIVATEPFSRNGGSARRQRRIFQLGQ